MESRVLLSAAASPLSASAASRAAASYSAMQAYFYRNDGTSLYREEYPVRSGDNTYSYEWPFGQAYAATVDMANIGSYSGDVTDRTAGLSHYYSSDGRSPNAGLTPNQASLPGYDSYVDAPLGGGGDKFYDDNEWTALASIRQYQQTGDAAALSRAESIFSLIVSGWDTNTSHPAPGGVFWTQAAWSQDRNTVSNMPGAEVGLQLFQITHNTYYLDWSTRMYNWVNANLRDPADGLYWDHINLAGTIEKTKWSYNQGVPIGVNVLFYEVTGDRTYLAQAEQIANAALSYYGSTNILQQPAIFNAIFFRNLLQLYTLDHNAAYGNYATSYADTVWANKRDSSTGLFHFTTDGYTQLLEQAGMTEIYALLAATPAHATAAVTNTQDAGSGSLRDAIQNSNADEISFAIPTRDPNYNATTHSFTINLSSQLEIARDLAIDGPGANLLTLKSNGSGRVLQVDGGVLAELDGLTISGGTAGQSQNGGAVASAGTLVINACALSGNSASSGQGGAVYVAGSGALLIRASTLSNDSAAQGGAIYSAGLLNAANCTISGNSATSSAGAIYNAGTTMIANCTIAGNSALNSRGGIASDPAGTLTIGNTILAANTAPTAADLAGAANSQGYNLIGTTSGSTGWISTDVTSNSASPLDPGLAPLGNYGGPTQTMALMPHSPALDRGSNALAAAAVLNADQRGLSRIYGAAADIGAYESQPPALMGDVNHDGVVNLTDLLLLIRKFGKVTPVYELGDLDGNGSVNLADFVVVARNYGSAVPASSAASALASGLVASYPTSPNDPGPQDMRKETLGRGRTVARVGRPLIT